MYQLQNQYINTAVSSAFIEKMNERLGTNYVVGQVTAFVPLYSYEYTTKSGITIQGITGYTYALDSEGKLVLVVDNVHVQGNAPDAEYNYYATSPDSEVVGSKTLPASWGTVDEFVQRLLADPQNPQMILLLGDHIDDYGSGNGTIRRWFDNAATGGPGIDLSKVIASDLGPYFGGAGYLSYGGIMLTEPLE